MLSRQLPTRSLPPSPVPIGYCGWNRRFVLRLHVCIEQSLRPHHFLTRKPYPFLTEGFGSSSAATAHPCSRHRSGDIPGSSSDPGALLAPALAQLQRRPGAAHGPPRAPARIHSSSGLSSEHGILKESLTRVPMILRYDFI